MLRIFFKTTFRNISRHKGFSFINIAGLTMGLTACLLIGLFVWDEKSFDKSIPGGERIYRVYYQITDAEGTSRIATTPPTFTTVFQQNFPEVEKALRVMEVKSKLLFEAGEKKLYEEKGVFADSGFFDLFPMPFKYGSAVDGISEPTSIFLSEAMAERYFGNANPVGKDITLEKTAFQIKGVFKNDPKFHLPLNFILPLARVSPEALASWETYAYNNYLKLKEGTDAQALEAKFQQLVAPRLKDPHSVFLPRFQALHDIHLKSADFKYDMSVRGNISYVRGLTIIAIFILLIACFNFVNLATAKSMQRAKEVGVRKTIGASKKNLMLHFMGETVLLTLISMTLSIVFCFLLLPVLNQFTEKQISFPLFSNPVLALLLVTLAFVVGILSGFYPALVLTRFQPIKVLKGAVVSETSPGRIPWLRHGLVVVQFSLSVLLIISAIVVIKQVNYLHQKDLGFTKDQILFFPMRGDNMAANYESFKNELQQSPGISSVSIGYGFPGDGFGDGMVKAQKEGEQKEIRATLLMVDENYLKTLDVELKAGRNFSKDIKTDKDEAYIINETAVKEYGFRTAEEALGKTLSWNTWRDPNLVKKGQIVGVVKDFHYKSLYDKLEPAVLQIYPQAYSKVAVRMKASGIESTIAHVKKVWSTFTPDYPIEYRFLDESFGKMYKAEDKLKSLLWIFTAITIFVACLGLFGLAAFAAERRRKEVGIRKVLGASVRGIVLLLSKDFIGLVVLSLIIASPVAWYFMNQWLQDFAYRIDINWWVFAVAAVTAISIAFLTVSFQAIRTAFANPVKSLRTE